MAQIKNVNQLIHRWAHEQVDKPFRKGNWYGDNTKLEYQGNIVAYRYRIKNTAYKFISKQFDARGAYDTGYDYADILNAMPDRKNAYAVYKIPYDSILEGKNVYSFKKWIENEFYHENYYILENVSNAKEFIYNNAVRTIYSVNSIEEIQFQLNHIPSFLLDYYPGVLEGYRINFTVFATRYYNWAATKSLDCEPVIVNHRIRDLLDYGYKLFFTPREIELFNAKSWAVIHKKYEDYSIKELTNIYLNDSDTKNKIETRHHDVLERIRKKRQQREEREAKKAHINFFDDLSEWKNNDNKRSMLRHPINSFDSIKKYGHGVITTRGVLISMDDAKNAYKIFKHYRVSDEFINYGVVDFSTYGYKAGNYTLDCIRKSNIIIDEELNRDDIPCLEIGCHTIPEFEIDDFINRNNLNWDDK